MGENRKFVPPANIETILANGEPKTLFIESWHDHVMKRHQIDSFTTIMNEKLYHVTPREDEIMMPYMEINGDHHMNWILILNKNTNEEVSRKNTRTVDMVNWKLYPSLTNSGKNVKK